MSSQEKVAVTETLCTRWACLWTLFVLSLAFLWGCVPQIPARTGTKIRDYQVEKIQPGKTTKRELFEWLGPPMAIAVRDEILTIPTQSVWVQNHLDFGGYYEIQSDTFFELFSSQQQLHEYQRIYYYYYAVSKQTAYLGLLVNYERGKTDIDKLWVLINEKTGIVDGYVFRKHNQEKPLQSPPPK
jgi:hypothetical protein